VRVEHEQSAIGKATGPRCGRVGAPGHTGHCIRAGEHAEGQFQIDDIARQWTDDRKLHLGPVGAREAMSLSGHEAEAGLESEYAAKGGWYANRAADV
jgi:hypothetical protein